MTILSVELAPRLTDSEEARSVRNKAVLESSLQKFRHERIDKASKFACVQLIS